MRKWPFEAALFLFASLIASPSHADVASSRVWFDAIGMDSKTQIQTDLILAGTYSGLVDGEFGPATYKAITSFQTELGDAPTGLLSARQTAELRKLAAQVEEAWGVELLEDEVSGATMLIPSTLLPNRNVTPNGTIYASADGALQLETIREMVESRSFRELFELLLVPFEGVAPTYQKFSDEFFAISGVGEDAGYYAYFLGDGDASTGILVTWNDGVSEEGSRVAAFVASHFIPTRRINADNDQTTVGAPSASAQQPDKFAGEQIGSFLLPSELPNVIRLRGEITASTPLEFIRALRARPEAKILQLSSEGGLVDPALIIAHEVHDRGLSTVVLPTEGCYSACAFVFLAGVQRNAMGQLGVHQVWNEQNDLVSGQAKLSDVIEALSDFGVHERVLTVMLRTPPADMHIFSNNELMALGINNFGERRAAVEQGVVPAGEAGAFADPAETSGTQALLLEASTDGATGAIPNTGKLTWTYGTDNEGFGTVYGVAEIQQAGLSATVKLHRSTGQNGPAYELAVDLFTSDRFLGGNVMQMPGALMKMESLVQGVPLVGQISRTDSNTFVFRFSDMPEDRVLNGELLSTKGWMDLALIYGTGRRAILTLEIDSLTNDAIRKTLLDYSNSLSGKGPRRP